MRNFILFLFILSCFSFGVIGTITILNNKEKVTDQAPAPIRITILNSDGDLRYQIMTYTVEYKDEDGDTYTFLACRNGGGSATMELLKVNGQLVSGIPREK